MLEVGQKIMDKKGNLYECLSIGHGFNNEWLGLKKCTYELKVLNYPRRPEMVGHILLNVSSKTVKETCDIIAK